MFLVVHAADISMPAVCFTVPGAPQSLLAVSVNSTVAVVSWLPPVVGVVPSQYYVNISCVESGDEITLIWLTNGSVLVDQLEPYAYCKIQVASHVSSSDSVATTFIRMPEDSNAFQFCPTDLLIDSFMCCV